MKFSRLGSNSVGVRRGSVVNDLVLTGNDGDAMPIMVVLDVFGARLSIRHYSFHENLFCPPILILRSNTGSDGSGGTQ